jgi:transcriptional regulator GlxA family with amidase domain
MAHVDLMLVVLRRCFGRPLAEAVGQVLLIETRPLQGKYVQANLLALGDELVARVETLVREALPRVPSVDAIARHLALSTRTLNRRIRAATGRSPLELVQSVRLTAAKALLQASHLSVDQVAERVGYQDATSLRRLMRRTMSVTPRQMRA